MLETELAIRSQLVGMCERRMQEAGIAESSVPNNPIYHYTTATGLMGILQQGVIFATHTNYLNDISEIKYGQHLAAQVINEQLQPLRDAIGRGFKTDQTPQDFLEPIAKEEWAIWALLEACENSISVQSKDHYIASFCEEDDLLSQWKGYGNQGGGYSIGLSLKTSTIDDKNNVFRVFQVVYDPQKQREVLRHILDDILTSLRNSQPSGGYGLDASNHVEYHAHIQAATDFFRVVGMRFKDKGFAQEKEWRFHACMSIKDAKNVKFREAKNILVPYLRLPINGPQIKVTTIRCGPSIRRDLSKESAEMLVSQTKFSTAQVVSSDIPFVST